MVAFYGTNFTAGGDLNISLVYQCFTDCKLVTTDMEIINPQILKPRNGGKEILILTFKKAADVEAVLSSAKKLKNSPYSYLSVKRWVPRNKFISSGYKRHPGWNASVRPPHFSHGKGNYYRQGTRGYGENQMNRKRNGYPNEYGNGYGPNEYGFPFYQFYPPPPPWFYQWQQ